ncbi:MAG: fasciclin domain-containing protein [Gemmatimonadota bacterium]
MKTAGGESRDIVTVAVEAGQFTTLATALKAAGLVEVLQGKGPFTVFAPTDEAFAKLPAGTVEALLKDPEKLRSILTYHVVAGRVPASDAMKLSHAKTVNGASLAIKVVDGQVKVDDATVVQADIMASNGVIHVIDRVVLPPSMRASK